MKEHPLNTEVYRCLKAINIDSVNEDDKKELLKFFVVTENSLIRNHIAMLFSDIGYDKAIPFIIKKVKDEKIKDKGTLVFALDGLNCEKYFLSFIRMISELGYEPRLMAYDLVCKYVNIVKKSMIREGIKTLEDYRVKLLNDPNSDKGENSILHFVEKTQELLLRFDK